MWLAGAILVVPLLRHDTNTWPALLVPGAIADLGANLVTGGEISAVLRVAAADVLEPLIIATAIRRWRDGRALFISTHN